MKIDNIDKQILNLLQENAKITNVELASKVGISPPAMLERVRRLEKDNFFKKYIAVINPDKVGKNIIALISVWLSAHQLSSIDSFTKQINKFDEVLECYHIAGKEDFILKIIASSIKDVENFLLKKLTKIPGVSKVNTKFVLSTVKYKTKIKID
jgi:Lrp/AsnC family leucine-responsive transcriptional regulator